MPPAAIVEFRPAKYWLICILWLPKGAAEAFPRFTAIIPMRKYPVNMRLEFVAGGVPAMIKYELPS